MKTSAILHGHLLAVANPRCGQCYGLGRRPTAEVPCGCALREIYRQCMRRHHELRSAPPWKGPWWLALRQLHYVIDIELVARRVLDPVMWKAWWLHAIEDRPWRECARLMGFDRGTWWHTFYRCAERLGLVYATMRPYPLWPFREYVARRADLQKASDELEQDLADKIRFDMQL